jgi:hypothetical protein
MAIETKCLTPDTRFITHVSTSSEDFDYITATVELPPNVISDLTEAEAELLEKLLHNQIELVLRPYFMIAELRQVNPCKETESRV